MTPRARLESKLIFLESKKTYENFSLSNEAPYFEVIPWHRSSSIRIPYSLRLPMPFFTFK